MPGSEPKSPTSPLRGITDAWGYVDTLADAIEPNARLSDAVAQRGTCDGAEPRARHRRRCCSGASGFDSAGVSAGGSLDGVRSGTVRHGDTYILNVNGEQLRVGDRDDVLDGWQKLRRFNDRSLIR